MKKTICFVTGSRADYGILFPVMKAVAAVPQFKLEIVATGMHLMKEFGNTCREIQKDGFNISAKINISYSEDTGYAMAISVGKAVIGFTRIFATLQPKLVFVLGDRGEMVAAALAANYLNIPVAHIHGGELSGHIDGMLRHVISKLAHIHFPATALSRQRLIKMGEEPGRIFLVGAPALDRILKEPIPAAWDIAIRYGIDLKKPFLLVVQHPVSTRSHEAAQQIKITLDTLKSLKMQTIVIYPNADAGGRSMIDVIKEYVRKYPLIKAFASLSHKHYLGLLKISSVLIGNSSSGIIEAPPFKVPVVNIGNRQEGRERSTNIIDVGYNQRAIVAAVKKALYDKAFKSRVKKCRNPYGDGRASSRIVKVLKGVRLNKNLLEKRITY